uniref:Uncharacterized protein n=1 Tax=Lepeophtheirus salmonis TaxID=72036 RepID=A0A0K2TAN3_LEPSM
MTEATCSWARNQECFWRKNYLLEALDIPLPTFLLDMADGPHIDPDDGNDVSLGYMCVKQVGYTTPFCFLFTHSVAHLKQSLFII